MLNIFNKWKSLLKNQLSIIKIVWSYNRTRQKETNPITNINFECDKDGISSH